MAVPLIALGGEHAAGVDVEVVSPQQPGRGVDLDRPVAREAIAGGGQDLQSAGDLPCPIVTHLVGGQPEHVAGSLVRVQGVGLGPTLAPHRRTVTGKENFNGKHRKQAFSVQAAAWPDGTLVDVSDPVPGRRHDSVALDLVVWGYQIRAATDQKP